MSLLHKLRDKLSRFYSAWFSPRKEIETSDHIKRNEITTPDFIDYDGMGNQGRFPERRDR